MFDRVEELGEILVREFGELPLRVRLIFKDKSGEYDRVTEWYYVKDKKNVEETYSRANEIYGYHFRTARGNIFDFWYESDKNLYNLVGVKIGKHDIDIEPGRIVYKSSISLL